jgi:regulation of enolase protein 1 (concanavalin A-like superfamily)
VGQAGSSGFSNGQFQVSGSGGDIWGTADAFHYLFTTPDHGPSGVVARVDSFSAAQPFAKAGVMVRRTLEASSPHVILDVKPDGGVEFMTRSAPGGDTTFVAGATATLPVWLRLSVSAGAVVGLMSSDGVSWTTVGSTPFENGFEGIVVTSHDTTTTAQATFEELAAGPEWPWYQADIGDVGLAGNAEVVHQETLVSGSGGDIWGTADAFHFLYSIARFTNRIVARVVGEQNTDPFAKAGLVMGDLTVSGRRVILDVKPDGNLEFMARTDSGTPMAFIAGANAAFPVWLRLTANGDAFTGEMSTDGSTWTTVGSVTMTGPTLALPGLAVTSHNQAALNTAQFDNIALENTGIMAPNQLINGGFEDSTVPNVGPGWVSDTIRGTPAVSETANAHGGAQNGVCRTTSLDCGIYQEVISRADTNFGLVIYARADHPGALIGINVNGQLFISQAVQVGGYQSYGMSVFTPNAGDVIRVWMYAPAAAGFVAIDDAVLTSTQIGTPP